MPTAAAAPSARALAAADPDRAHRSRRKRAARLERPLLLAGLVLVTAHLLDLALSGPDTTVLGVVVIAAAPVLWAAAQPRVTRPTRAALGVVSGLLTAGFGVVSHGLHTVLAGPAWTDVTGLGMIAGGLALVASGLAAALAPRRRREPAASAPHRAAHVVGWVAGLAVAAIVVFPVVMTALMTTHAPRWPIHESSLDVPHEEVRIATADGTKLSAWYVPSRNGAAVLLTHGSGGSRQRVADRAEMLARHGYGVLALDNPGNGESEGHNNGLGDNAQPGIDAALAYLTKRPGVDPERIAGFGVSLGAEVVLEAAARDGRLRAVVADGAARPSDARRYGDEPAAEEGLGWLAQQAVRAVSGMRPAPSLTGLMPRIAPRPVLLVAAGGVRDEALTNRAYRDAAGPSTTLWERPGASHTAGLKRDPGRYERRTVGFLDRALGA